MVTIRKEVPSTSERATISFNNSRVDTYFQQLLSQQVKKGFVVCYLIFDTSNRFIGFFTLRTSIIVPEDRPNDTKKLASQYVDIPALFIPYMGIAKDFQGQGYGNVLMFHVFNTSLTLSKEAGIQCLILDFEQSEEVKLFAFYSHFGFKRLKVESNRMYITIQDIALSASRT